MPDTEHPSTPMAASNTHRVGSQPTQTDRGRTALRVARGDPNKMHPEDEPQRERIRSAEVADRLLVEAGPGTGKTEMAAIRIARLMQTGHSPGTLLVLSFSRSAVRNLTDRLARLEHADDKILEQLRHVSIRTFDSWSFRMLRLLQNPVPMLLARGHDENIEHLTELIKGRQQEAIRELIGNRQHLIVDEFQDLPGVRGELVLALLDLLSPAGQPGAGFTILGDPAQAIYGFAAMGTTRVFPTPAEYWKKITSTYGAELELVTLTHNFRARKPLADLSSSLRQVLLSRRSDEEKLRIVRERLAGLPSPPQPASPEWLDTDDTGSRAILTRTNGESLRVLTHLFGRNIEGHETPVRLRAGNHASLPPAWIAALLSRLRSPELPRAQFDRIYEHLVGEWDDATPENLGLPDRETTWSRLCGASGAPEEAARIQIRQLRSQLNWPDAFPDDQLAGEDGLLVTTIHQSKGLEFDIVTVLDAPRNAQEESSSGGGRYDLSIREEANVNYVAITRAGRELNRMDGKGVFQTPSPWKLRNGRERLCHWRNRWMNVELGLRGDLDPFGFVDAKLHGGPKAVEEVQSHLLRGVRTLLGHKVMLVKRAYDGKAFWHVHLQTPGGAGLLIGRTGPQVARDLLDLLWDRGFSLPPTIWNLRIAAIGTIASDIEFPLEEPYRTSRLWLGVSLFGTGDFKTHRRKR